MNESINTAAIERLRRREEFLWINPDRPPVRETLPALPLSRADIADAADRFTRFAPLIAALFPETRETGGIIESPLIPVPKMQAACGSFSRRGVPPGRLYVKADHLLPVAGSVKARGGIHEVLCHAEELARAHGFLRGDEPYTALLGKDARALFGAHTVSVGSTGNLGLSIGTMAAALGFRATVHMSADAKAWKKDLLRARSVTVVEHASDYSAAVKAGRDEAARDGNAYFVDDENSSRLFTGYAVAGERLEAQFASAGVRVDGEHPLFVYIPCGVGGAPGGICFGLAHAFGDDAHCFFAEPLESACMMLGLLAGFSGDVYDIGLTNMTAADGLAVGRASAFAGGMITRLVAGCFTVDDSRLFRDLALLYRTENLRIEPSAAAGFPGPAMVRSGGEGANYLDAHGLAGKEAQITHVIWTTGGSLAPIHEFERYLARG
ncbi:MAG: D-serine ammonia-lyase [Spirochaetes bacterium]|nr:MAG: D-serine ammonia-lyase [Spirochaetota bacterium]